MSPAPRPTPKDVPDTARSTATVSRRPSVRGGSTTAANASAPSAKTPQVHHEPHVDIRVVYINDDDSIHSDDVIARVERTAEHATKKDFISELATTLRMLADEFEAQA